MRLARVATPEGPASAVAEGDRWYLVDDVFAARPVRTGRSVPADGARLLAPCTPQVVVGMAHNQRPADGARRPAQAFLKSARTVVGPGDGIVVRPSLGATQVEGELAAVIGRHVRDLTPAQARTAVLGFTIGNDVTALDQIPQDELLTQAKQGDGFTPLGPWIETELPDPDDVAVRVLLDGVVVATGTTADLLDGLVDQLVYVTRYLSLGPGDVVLGGCPGTFATVQPGQRVRIEMDGIGALESTTGTEPR